MINVPGWCLLLLYQHCSFDYAEGSVENNFILTRSTTVSMNKSDRHTSKIK